MAMSSKQSSKRTNGGRNRSIMKEMHGYKFLPTEMPPSFIAQPWNNIILVIRKTGAPATWGLKISDITIALRAQGGFTNVTEDEEKKKVQFDLRFKSLSAWAVDGLAFALMPMDLLATNSELCRIDSNPQRNMYARAGYKYPLAQSSMTFSGYARSATTIATFLGASTYEVHVNLLWKGADSSLPSLAYVYPNSRKMRIHELIRELQLEEEGIGVARSDDSLSVLGDT